MKILEKTQPKARDYLHIHTLYFDTKGWISLLRGRYNEAYDILQETLRILEEELHDQGLTSKVKCHLAEALIGLDRDAEARKYTKESLELIEPSKVWLSIGACYRIFGQLEARAGNTEEACRRFREAIALFNKIGARYDMALTRYLGASSGVFPYGEKQALLFLAKEYFESENVEHLAKQATLELSSFQISPRLIPDRSRAKIPRIVTADDEMKHILSMAEHIAPSDMSVLLTGATGTGKDMLARYIHHHSGRTGRFVSINAAAIPDSMIESELFGHRRGAFTNADRDKVGLIEVAHEGTLYLNEIADSSKELQAKLLDVLENHTIRRLGETREREVAFRLIAATNHDLKRLIEDGRFRIDLYHRLSEVPFSLPPLKDRENDIPALLAHFFSIAGVEVDTESNDFARLARILSRREWPGNVRQLEAEAKRLALLSGGNVTSMIQFAATDQRSERDQIYDLLKQSGWNRREVARRLGVSDTTIRRKIRKYKLDHE